MSLRNKRRLQLPPVDAVLGRYIMHTRADAVRNRWWAGVAWLVLLLVAGALYAYLGLVRQYS